jgi:hypothetical protein
VRRIAQLAGIACLTEADQVGGSLQVVYPALDAKVKNVTVAYSVEHQDEVRKADPSTLPSHLIGPRFPVASASGTRARGGNACMHKPSVFVLPGWCRSICSSSLPTLPAQPSARRETSRQQLSGRCVLCWQVQGILKHLQHVWVRQRGTANG